MSSEHQSPTKSKKKKRKYDTGVITFGTPAAFPQPQKKQDKRNVKIFE